MKKFFAVFIAAFAVILTGCDDSAAEESDDYMKTAMIYQCSIMDQAGNYLKKAAPGKKVVFVIEPGLWKTENGRKLLEAQKKAFDKAYGGSVELVEFEVEGLNEEDGDSYADAMKVADFEKLVAENESADIFVLTVGLPSGDQVPDFKGKTVFLTNSGIIETKDLKSAIEAGIITAVVTGNGKKIDPYFEPDEDKLKEAFNTRWVIVDKYNLDKLK